MRSPTPTDCFPCETYVLCLWHLSSIFPLGRMSYSCIIFHIYLPQMEDRNLLFLSLIPAPLPKVQRHCKLTFKNSCTYFLSPQSITGTENFFPCSCAHLEHLGPSLFLLSTRHSLLSPERRKSQLNNCLNQIG